VTLCCEKAFAIGYTLTVVATFLRDEDTIPGAGIHASMVNDSPSLSSPELTMPAFDIFFIREAIRRRHI
jgi:hypothetical protein